MFATIKHLIPEPRQADQPRRYVGRHRQPEQAVSVSSASVSSEAEVKAEEKAETAAA